jgi:hypothetical protein
MPASSQRRSRSRLWSRSLYLRMLRTKLRYVVPATPVRLRDIERPLSAHSARHDQNTFPFDSFQYRFGLAGFLELTTDRVAGCDANSNDEEAREDDPEAEQAAPNIHSPVLIPILTSPRSSALRTGNAPRCFTYKSRRLVDTRANRGLDVSSQGRDGVTKMQGLRLGYWLVCPSRSRRKASSQAAHNGGRSICTMSQSRSSRMASYS